MKPHWPPERPRGGPYWERGTAAGEAAAVEAGAAEEAAAGVMEMGAAVACANDGLLCCLFGATMTTWPALMKTLSPLLIASRRSCLSVNRSWACNSV